MKTKKDKTIDEEIVINVREALRSNIVGSQAQGISLRELIKKPLEDGCNILLDFRGISGLSVISTQEAFEWAFKKYGEDLLSTRIKVQSYDKDWTSSFENTILKYAGHVQVKEGKRR